MRNWQRTLAGGHVEALRVIGTRSYYELDANAVPIDPAGSPLGDAIEALSRAARAAALRFGPGSSASSPTVGRQRGSAGCCSSSGAAAGTLADRAAGGNPVHGLLPDEEQAILELFESWGPVDLSHRKLAHRGNTVRLHEAIGYVTPDDEHTGRGDTIRAARANGLARADNQRRLWRRRHRSQQADQ